jgi:acetylornithine deacetylase/succinyl-diaminopimelate desuccinylase-like protein
MKDIRARIGKACAVLAATAALSFVPGLAAAGVGADTPVEERLSQYLQVDTTNPPGNEIAGARFLGKILEEAGIAYETVESAPGRASLWARLPAADRATAKPGIVLLHHIDVVSASSGHWDIPPLSGAIHNGYVYGRGALDTKGLGIMQLQAFLALADSGAKLNRDVIYMATADEEAGGHFGAGWLVENHPELFEGVGFLLNEGGAGMVVSDSQSVMMVEATQKVPLWLRLTATGRPGHGSAPQRETAVTRLVRAARRIVDTDFPVRIIEPVDVMFRAMAPYQPTAQGREDFADLATAAQRPGFLLELQLQQPSTHALLRNTCSMTRLSASDKVNVVPPEASLELDCRLLPDQSPQAFLEELMLIVNDPHITAEILVSFAPAVSSTDTELFRAIEAVTEKYYPGAPVVPSVVGGFTDSHFFRDLGIVSYGYAPILLTPTERSGIHGNNERISVQSLELGTASFTELLRNLAID